MDGCRFLLSGLMHMPRKLTTISMGSKRQRPKKVKVCAGYSELMG